MFKTSPFYLLCVLFVFSSNTAKAGKIERAYEALSVYNYFKAKQLFEKKWKNNKAAASYGLSVIYGRSDNPFFNLDSAHLHITLAESSFSTLEVKEKGKLKKFGLDSLSIEQWLDSIDLKSFRHAVKMNSVNEFERYMLAHFDSEYRQLAENLRDSLVYESVQQTNSSKSYLSFIETYPNSYLKNDASTNYENLLFQELIEKNSIRAYQNFVKSFPNHPKVEAAEDSIFIKSIEHKWLKEYKSFIDQNPNNHNVELAWRSIYKLFTAKYSPQVIQEFKQQFPDYPFKEELQQDFDLASEVFLPFKKDGLWGFMNEEGTIKIPAKFSFVEQFWEGLAIAGLNGKVGFINKLGDTVVPFEFDEAFSFKDGVAVVSKDQYFGIINRVNRLIAPFKYDFIEPFYSNIALAAKETGYGFLDHSGKELTSFDFSYATDFSKNYSVITKGDRMALLDTSLQVIIPFVYAKLSFFYDSLFIAKNDTLYGLVSLKGDTILNFDYNRIDELSAGLALIQKEQKYGYINSKGDLSIPITYEYNLSAPIWGKFEDGYAKFQRNGKFGVIGKDGKEVSPAIFENLKNYNRKSLFPVKKKENWGFSNGDLQLKIKYIYKAAEAFQANTAIVKNDTAYGVINKDAQWVIKPQYRSIFRLSDSTFVVKRVKTAVVNGTEEELIPFEYESIEELDNGLLRLEREDEVYYFHLSEMRFIRPKQ